MANVLDFPVTELFGCQPGYPLNQNLCPPGQGFHNGIDYGCPTGTTIIVNGVVIGISGATGYVTGAHCHVGRWVSGKATNPGVGNGFTFNSAVVTEVNQDATNGKYVRVQGDGASWVYLHMSDNSKVKVGQVLNGSQGGTVTIESGDNWYNRLNKLHLQVRGKPLSRDVFNSFVGKDTLTFIEAVSDNAEADAVQHAQDVGLVAVRDKWDQQIYGLQDQVKALNDEIVKLKAGQTVSQDEIDALAKQADDLEQAIKKVNQ